MVFENQEEVSGEKLELSIIVPVYNVEKYLKECLSSISKIKNINYEILIVNDGSPDNSQKIIDEFCKNNNRAKFFIKENGGISSARNYGLKKAQGEYIWFVDSDDLINYEEFQRFFFEVKKEKIDVAIGNYYFLNGDKIIKEKELMFHNNLSGIEVLNKQGGELLEKGFVWRILYRRDFLEKNNIIFKEKIVAEDQLFNIFCFLKADKVKFKNNFIYYYRLNREGSLTNNIKSEELFARSGYEIVLELLKVKESQNNFYIKKNMFAHYLTYVKYFKIRDFELEKKLWSMKGMFFLKLEKKYKIWRAFRKLK